MLSSKKETKIEVFMRIKKQSNIKAIFLTLISISVFCTLNSQNTKLGLRVNSSMSKLTGDYQLFSHSKKIQTINLL